MVREECLSVIDRTPFSLEDLPFMNELRSRFSLRLAAQIEAWWSSCFNLPRSSFLTVEDSSIAVQYVRQGLGFTILPDIVIYGSEPDFFRVPISDRLGNYLTCQTWLFTGQKVWRIRSIRQLYNL